VPIEDGRPTPYAELERMSDAELVAHARKRRADGDAGGETAKTCVALVFERRRALVRAICAAKAPVDVVDDLESQVYLRFVRAVYTQTAPMQNPSGLLVKMARNVIASHFEKRRGEPVPIGELPDVADTDEGLDDVGVSEAVEAILAVLTDRQREVVIGKVFKNLPAAEIGRRLDIKPGHVDVIFFHALKKMREVVER
jgi:RNA polymerase sigma factor (sigma-70 family)